MSNRTKLLVGAVIVVVSFAFGRYSAPEKIKTEIKVVEVEKKESSTSKKEDTKKTIVKKPDGTVVTIIDRKKSEDTKTKEDKNTQKDNITQVTKDTGRTSISVLGGYGVFGNSQQPVYGIHASRTLIGPISGGLWGLSNGIIGVSCGLTF